MCDSSASVLVSVAVRDPEQREIERDKQLDNRGEAQGMIKVA